MTVTGNSTLANHRRIIVLTYEICGFCKGKKEVERLEERRESGWYPNTMIEHSMADAWIRADKYAPLRWFTCLCPSCHGAGNVDVEHVSCKIF